MQPVHFIKVMLGFSNFAMYFLCDCVAKTSSVVFQNFLCVDVHMYIYVWIKRPSVYFLLWIKHPHMYFYMWMKRPSICISTWNIHPCIFYTSYVNETSSHVFATWGRNILIQIEGILLGRRMRESRSLLGSRQSEGVGLVRRLRISV